MLCGFAAIRQWVFNAEPVNNENIESAFRLLVSKMNVTHSIRLLATQAISVPAIAGFFRPVVLLPTSMISGLSIQELEAILAHELAHVRRHDYIVNILQVTFETLFFHHPIVWWLSNRMRIEREYCCDDIAAQSFGGQIELAKALAKLEEIRSTNGSLAVAANGGSLVSRIQRLAGRKTNESFTWPIGIFAIFAALTLGSWIGVSSVSANLKPEFEQISNQPISGREFGKKDDDQAEPEYKLQKNESKKRDSVTGIEKSVLADIKLESGSDTSLKTSSFDAVYSNVMLYTFIPQRIAKELKAIELGTIDFGKVAPAIPGKKQMLWMPLAGEKKIDSSQAPSADKKTLYRVNEITKPLADGKIVPYETDSIWVPGHLSFYGMNKTKQHKFKVVRIEKVNLGFGLPFGPINALVSNDENSEFGVLGGDWTQVVTGTKNEVMWWSATGTFFLMPKDQSPQPAPKKVDQALDRVAQKSDENRKTKKNNSVIRDLPQVKSTGGTFVDPALTRGNIKASRTIHLNEKTRRSTGWVKSPAGLLPFDKKLEFDDRSICLTLMGDIVAINQKTEELAWHLPWNKSQPMWQSVSIVEWETAEKKVNALELFAANETTGTLTYQYHSLQTGKKISLPNQVKTKAKVQSRTTSNAPKIYVDKKVNGKVTRAYFKAKREGRSPIDVLKSNAKALLKNGPAGLNITEMETIVSAKPRYLLGRGMDTDELMMSLPEGSKAELVFTGENIEIETKKDVVSITTTNGKVQWVDSVGTVRATATADGGMKHLIVECKYSNNEVVAVLKTLAKNGEDKHPVQVIFDIGSGDLDNESPSHGSVRYEIQPWDPKGKEPARIKIKYHYEMKRVAEEAEEITGETWREILMKKQKHS